MYETDFLNLFLRECISKFFPALEMGKILTFGFKMKNVKISLLCQNFQFPIIWYTQPWYAASLTWH